MREIRDMLRGKRAAFFDLDGTLVDSIGVWNDADEQLARELTGAAPDRAEIRSLREAALRKFRNEPEPYLCYCGLLRERYGTDLTARQVQARRQAIAHGMLERVDYKPGADVFLWALKQRGYTLALTTTGRRGSLDIYRTKNRNFAAKGPVDELFDRVYTCEDVPRIKPDPEIYLRAAAELGLDPAACLVFEDSLSGVQAAKAAGLEVCAVYDRHSDPDRAAIDALADWRTADWPSLLAALGLGEQKETRA